MVMRETGSVSFWTQNDQSAVTYYFPAERAAYLRKRSQRRRQRTQRAILMGLTALAALLGFVAGRAVASGEAKPAPLARYITVGEGDTLWSLAKKHGDHSTPLTDRLDALTAVNPQAASGMLTPGQRLRLP
jgi:Tfp pilus assembly protein FimV